MEYNSVEAFFGIFLLIMFIIGMGCCVIAGYMAHKSKAKGKSE